MKRTLTTILITLCLSAITLAQQANPNLMLDGSVQISASSQKLGFPAHAAFDGDRTGYGWAQGGGWNDDDYGVFPDWIQAVWPRLMSVSRVVVYSVQNGYANPVEPSDTDTCTNHGVKDFLIQKTTDGGASWHTIWGVSGNTLCKRTVGFTPQRMNGLRVLVTASWDGSSRTTEVEAFAR